MIVGGAIMTTLQQTDRLKPAENRGIELWIQFD
jgi:hypothetical protein